MQEALQTAYALVAQRDYTTSEVIKKLTSRGCSEATARAVAEQMVAKVSWHCAPVLTCAAHQGTKVLRCVQCWHPFNWFCDGSHCSNMKARLGWHGLLT
jgi:hypothetical protein